MTYEEYKAQREKLCAEAKAALEASNIIDGNKKMEEVEALDKQYDAEAKATANLEALTNRTVVNKDMVTPTKVETTSASASQQEDVYNSEEYRKAFMNYVRKGTSIPDKFMNTDASTKTSDVGSVIPTTIMEKIVEKLESTGMILPLVTRTSYKGGLSIPTSSVKPTATWVNEGAGSDKQKKTTGNITFNYYKLRCAVSESIETTVTTLGVFETTFIKNVVEAMTKAVEQAIISGSGSGQPTGILTETVVSGQNIDIAADANPNYQTLIDAEAALPLAYEQNAKWCMTKKTFMKFEGMVDSSGQPIAKTNYGIAGKPERVLLGREVVCNDYMTSLGAAIASDTIVAFIFNFEDYVLNTNYEMTVKRYEDNDNDDMVTKAIMLTDGKVIDKNSLVTVTKKA